MRTPPAWLFLVGILGLVISTAFCGIGAYLIAQQVAVDFGKSGVQFSGNFNNFLQSQPTVTLTPIAATLTPTNTPPPGVTFTPAPTSTDAPTATLDPNEGIPELKDPRRITILLMGIDQRVGYTTDTAYRTDTMMLISVNPVTKQVGMLSIPRDLWVDIPGYQPNRINTANEIGDAYNYPGGGGPALAAATVQQNFGIKVDKYIRINFNVFESVVNTLAPDGIEICVNEEIHDPSYPDVGFGFIDVHFMPGCQMMNATQLLQYARTRHTQGGDFDRARRQQQVLKAAQAKFLSVGGITSFVTQIGTLWQELAGSVVTNLTIDDILALGRLASEIKPENITSAVIDVGQVDFGKSPTGDDILIPHMGEIQQLILSVFSPQPPATLAELRERSEKEGAKVVIYNNTTVSGLAGKTQEWLIGRVTITSVGNIPEPTNSPTIIRIYGGSYSWTAKYIAAVMGLPEDRIEPGRDGLIPDGVMIVVGEDIQTKLSVQPTEAATPAPTP
ncbi:MAG TPA: LCP family protein [Phototrophicaceae bacterium]|jgi:LCP family protein required for cell wall assembly|nr:LCP family protein [Phototrophicaceae bacterium]